MRVYDPHRGVFTSGICAVTTRFCGHESGSFGETVLFLFLNLFFQKVYNSDFAMTACKSDTIRRKRLGNVVSTDDNGFQTLISLNRGVPALDSVKLVKKAIKKKRRKGCKKSKRRV